MSVLTLGILDAVGCPHYNTSHKQTGELRADSFQEMMHREFPNNTGIGIDDYAALEIHNNSFRVLASKNNAGLYKTTPKDSLGKATVQYIDPSSGNMPLSELTL